MGQLSTNLIGNLVCLSMSATQWPTYRELYKRPYVIESNHA